MALQVFRNGTLIADYGEVSSSLVITRDDGCPFLNRDTFMSLLKDKERAVAAWERALLVEPFPPF